jgi:dynein heavy chain 2, cytosolic
VQLLEKELALVPLRALISSAYLTYLGAANETVREAQLKEWLSGLKQPEYNFRNFLSSESEMLTWKKEGLPADTLSMENAIMIMNSQRTPLVIDPAT